MSNGMFTKLEGQIRGATQQEASLLQLAENLQAECFDEEDRRMVQQKLQDVQATKSLLEQTLLKKREIYQNQIQGLEKQLHLRQKTLESLDKKQHIFQEFPDVLEFFARKQSRLNDSLTVVRQQLQE